MKKKLIYAIAAFAVMLFVFTGCRNNNDPSASPISQTPSPWPSPLGTINLVPDPTASKEAALPKIPDAISAGNAEPTIKVYITKNKQIKEMKLEEYVAGVVAGEVWPDWPEEALKAQAILARTFVLQFIAEKGQSKYEGAHISTDITEAQAWSDDVSDSIKKAVSQTKGMIVAYKGDYIIPWFHSNAAGKTATAKEGLAYDKNEPPYIVSVESDDSLAPADEKIWSHKFSVDEVLKACKELGHDFKTIDSISIGEKGPSGRAVYIKINGTNVSAVNLRLKLDSTVFRSTLITQVDVGDGKVYFEGKGYGHGVGMSQWGANKMAKDGKKAETIIKHYFKNVEVGKIY